MSKNSWVIKLMDKGMSRDEAEYEYENNILPALEARDVSIEFSVSKVKKKKKDTKVASLRSSKDKKFKGHTSYTT
jgi:hypothetical protein